MADVTSCNSCTRRDDIYSDYGFLSIPFLPFNFPLLLFFHPLSSSLPFLCPSFPYPFPNSHPSTSSSFFSLASSPFPSAVGVYACCRYFSGSAMLRFSGFLWCHCYLAIGFFRVRAPVGGVRGPLNRRIALFCQDQSRRGRRQQQEQQQRSTLLKLKGPRKEWGDVADHDGVARFLFDTATHSLLRFDLVDRKGFICFYGEHSYGTGNYPFRQVRVTSFNDAIESHVRRLSMH